MAGSFTVSIGAKDSASGTIDGINKRMAAFSKEVSRTRAPFDQLATNYKKLTQVTGLDKISGGMQAVARTGLDAFRSITRIVEPLAAITGAASLAGIYKLATSWANFGSALGNAANRAGLSAEKLHELENAGRLAGVSAESVAGGMTALRDNMVKATGGQAPQVIAMLQALGLSADDARRYSQDATRALPELADKIAALKDPTLQAQAATALFGGAGEAMLPFLRRGSAGIAEYTEKARKYGLINQDGVDAANRLREAQSTLQLSVEGLGNTLVQKLEPALAPVLKQMADWIGRNRDWIAQGIGDRIGEFVTWLKSIDWTKVGTDIGTIFTAVSDVAKALGGWIPVGEALLAFFAVAWLAKIMVPILAVSSALLKLPGQAATAAAGAKAEMEKGGVGKGAWTADKLNGAMGKLGLAGMAWAATDAVGAATEQKDDGYANLMHNMAFDMNPMHWTQSYHAGQEGAKPPGAAAAGGAPNGGPAQGPASTTPLPASPKATQDQWNTDLKQLQDKGWSKEQASGILGNLDQESGGRAQITGDSGQAYGMAQWHGDRQATFAKQFGHDIKQSTHAEQVDFVNWELNNTEKGAGDRLRQAKTVGDSAATVRKYYERPANATGQEDAWRTALADRIYAGASAPAGPDRALPQNAGTASNPGGAPPAKVEGQIGVGINLAGAPPGTTVATTQTGANLAPLKVDRSGVGVGGGMLGAI